LLESPGGSVNLTPDAGTFINRRNRTPVRLPLLTTNKTRGPKAAHNAAIVGLAALLKGRKP
jgi:hypothetical protein